MLLIPRLRTLSAFRYILCLRCQIHRFKEASPHVSTSNRCVSAAGFFKLKKWIKSSRKWRLFGSKLDIFAHNSRLCTKGGMVAIVTSAKCTRPSVPARAYPPERTEGGIHTSHIATMSLEVHTTFCVQIGGKSRVACECIVSRGQSSFVRYEHFADWSGRYEHYRPLKRAVWTFRPILTPRHNWLHATLRTSMQCDFFRPFGHKRIY